jgi:endonuclease-3
VASAGSSPAADPSEVVGRVRRLEAALERRYGTADKPQLDPLDELILTILSQSTTDANRDRAWRSLRERYADWETVRRAPSHELEQTLRIAGLGRQKTAAIQSALDRLHEEVGRLSLDHLADMDDEEAIGYLSGFTGVGVKTAACVLCFAMRRPVIPVDTHVHRLSRRLGIVGPGAGAEATHHRLNQVVPEDLRFSLHMHMIEHGRQVCKARKPACGECIVRELCPRIGVD